MDRSSDAARRHACARRCLYHGAGSVFRTGTGRTHDDRGGDQRVEPLDGGVPGSTLDWLMPRLAGDLLQTDLVPHDNAAAVDQKGAIAAQMRQHTTDGLYRQPEMVCHVGPAHWQIQCTWLRLWHPLDHFQQETGDPL